MSHRVFSLFPDAWSLEIHADTGSGYSLQIHGTSAGFDSRFLERIKRDRNARRDFTGWPAFDVHTDTHASYLNAAFTTSFGIGYDQCIAVVANTIRDARPAPTGFPTLFIQREKLLGALVAASGLPRDAVDVALRGFTVSPDHLLAEHRVGYRPKQHSRAYKRGFFLFPHQTGPHLAFSTAMAKECMIHLCNGVSYLHLPNEWITPATEAALTQLSGAAGSWFENVVQKNLSALRFVGARCKDSIGIGAKRVIIPSSVGEIDFLGFHPDEKILLLVESKMAFTGLEATFWRDDISQFTKGDKSFAPKFRRKISWVRENEEAIANALGAPKLSTLHSAMITLYPCIAAEVIKDFPCVSLAEFMLDYQNKGSWPYL